MDVSLPKSMFSSKLISFKVCSVLNLLFCYLIFYPESDSGFGLRSSYLSSPKSENRSNGYVLCSASASLTNIDSC